MKNLIKNIIALLLIVILNSCGEKPEEKAIKDFIQTSGKSKLDLDVKLIENLAVEPIKSIDSVKYIDSVLVSLGKSIRRREEISMIDTKNKIEMKKIELKYASDAHLKELIRQGIASYQNVLDVQNHMIQQIDSGKYENLNTQTSLLSKQKAKYELSPEKVLALKYQCKYKFKNPLLNGIEEETTKYFIVDTLKTRVIGAYN